MDTRSAYPRAYSIPDNEGDYWLVIDTTSAPSEGAEVAGPWTLELSICLYGTYSCSYYQTIQSPQALIEHYKMTITIKDEEDEPDEEGA